MSHLRYSHPAGACTLLGEPVPRIHPSPHSPSHSHLASGVEIANSPLEHGACL